MYHVDYYTLLNVQYTNAYIRATNSFHVLTNEGNLQQKYNQ
jgi:hypothetical protein